MKKESNIPGCCYHVLSGECDEVVKPRVPKTEADVATLEPPRRCRHHHQRQHRVDSFLSPLSYIERRKWSWFFLFFVHLEFFFFACSSFVRGGTGKLRVLFLGGFTSRGQLYARVDLVVFVCFHANELRRLL